MKGNEDSNRTLKPRSIIKLPPMQPWRFYNNKRIEELAQQAQKNYDNPEYDHSTKKWLTREEEMELEQLLGEGFDTWSKFDYSGFVQGCVTFGPSDYAHIAEAKQQRKWRSIRKCFGPKESRNEREK